MQLDEDMQQHDRLLALIEKSPANIDAVVARQRKDFTEQFFEHLRIRIQASYDDQKRREGSLGFKIFLKPVFSVSLYPC